MVNTLKQLAARIQEQALEMADLRSALDVQFERIAQMQAELDVIPTARERRKFILARLRPPSNNGNGRQPSFKSDSGPHPTVRPK